jgi:hypothetical protein
MRVDWPHAMAERCGQASTGSQEGTLRISSIEEYIDARVRSFRSMRVTVQDSELVRITYSREIL